MNIHAAAVMDALGYFPFFSGLLPLYRNVLSLVWRVLSWMPYMSNDSMLERQHHNDGQPEDMGRTL